MKTSKLWPEIKRIPHPPRRVPLVGDVIGATPKTPFQGAMRWARELGPIFQMKAPGFQMVVVSGADLVAELSDESRFAKHVGFGIDAYRKVTGDGLFTAFNDEPNWQLAHDVLMPAFTQEAMRRYHSAMVATTNDLIAAWDQQCDGAPVDVVMDMTRQALETIGRAGFGYSFDSFKSAQPHPYVMAMLSTLQHSVKMPLKKMMEERQNNENIRYMHDLVDDVVRARQESGDTGTHDLLGAMLNTTQPDNGARLDLENIRNQITTFLIAGFGTSAGLMSFALYFLSKHPDVLAKAREEVDRVVGDGEIGFEQVGKLRYLRRILDESLRLWPPAAVFMREARTDTLLGGKYPMRKGAWALVLTPMLHRDAGWGGDVEAFDPDRFAPEAIRSRPGHLYKPFGTGARACIGRQFAQHEATIVLAALLQRYNLTGQPDYELAVGETGFFMPAGFLLNVSRRVPAAAIHPDIVAEATAAGCPHLINHN